MIIIPAIDLKEGKCVRLRQGMMETSTVFNESPADQARKWADEGAQRIHVVDLDGSTQGSPRNLKAVKAIRAAVNVPVQLGGGIRDEDTAVMYLDLGVDAVILGTAAARQTDETLKLTDKFPGKIAVGIDARNGMVAIQGWTETSQVYAKDLARIYDGKVYAFIYTDIERDGMMKGPNIAATRDFATGLQSPVILSGGISKYGDIEQAKTLAEVGVTGIIIGRALYEGTVGLKNAIRMVE